MLRAIERIGAPAARYAQTPSVPAPSPRAGSQETI